MQVIHFVDGICGSGKTTRALEFATKSAKAGNNIIIASPSMALSEQSFNNALKLGAPCHRFDSSTHPDQVYAALTALLKEKQNGCIAFITHKCLLSMPWWGSHQSDWHLIMDEIPQVDQNWCWTLNHDQTRGFLFDSIEAQEDQQNLYLQLLAKAGSKSWLRDVATNARGDTMIDWLPEFI